MDKNQENSPVSQGRRHRIGRLLLRNSPGLAYLAWVSYTAVLVIHSLATWDQPDANLAPVVPVLQTLPWSLVVGLTPALPETVDLVAFIVVIVASALINAAILNWLCRSVARLATRGLKHIRGASALTA